MKIRVETGSVIAGARSRRRPMKKHGWWLGLYEYWVWDKNKMVIEHGVVENALVDEGEQVMLDVFLRNGTPPSNFYLGLCNSTPNDQTTLATLTGEPSGNGYERKQIERSAVGWPVLMLDNGDYQVTSKLVTFTADGGVIGPVVSMFLCDVVSGTSGKLISWAALSQSRTLQDQESLGCKMRIKLQ